MGAMASQNTSFTIVYSAVYSGEDQRNYRSSESLAFVRGIYRFPAQRASNAENVSIRWRQHAKTKHHWSYVRKPTIISGLLLQRTSNSGSVLMSLCHDAGIVTLGSHSGVSVRRASGQDSCSEEPGRLATPQLRNWRAPGFVPFCCRIFPEIKGVCLSDTPI